MVHDAIYVGNPVPGAGSQEFACNARTVLAAFAFVGSQRQHRLDSISCTFSFGSCFVLTSDTHRLDIWIRLDTWFLLVVDNAVLVM